MNYLIYNGKIKAITHVINYNYTDKTNKLFEKNIESKTYVLKGEDYNKILKEIEMDILNGGNKNIELKVENVDCDDVINYDGIEASSEEEAEKIINNLTLEEQLFEAQFELDSLKLGLTE